MLSCFDAFSKVAVREKTVKAMTIVYAKRTGEYAKIKQVIDSVHGALKKEKISAGLGFDLYYGSPRDVAKEKLRSLSGIILDADDEGKADSLSRLDEISE